MAPMIPSCTINFELPSERTALENQILGKYQEIDDELYMISSVRTLQKDQPNQPFKKATRSRQNQIFNQDDIDELKSLQILGETHDGQLIILPKKIGLVSQATPKQLNLAKLLVKEENHDRMIIWKHTIFENDNLKSSDMGKVKSTYADQIFKKAKTGHWFLRKNGEWVQKTAAKKDDVIQ